jgi:hypothetical protein
MCGATSDVRFGPKRTPRKRTVERLCCCTAQTCLKQKLLRITFFLLCPHDAPYDTGREGNHGLTIPPDVLAIADEVIE